MIKTLKELEDCICQNNIYVISYFSELRKHWLDQIKELETLQELDKYDEEGANKIEVIKLFLGID